MDKSYFPIKIKFVDTNEEKIINNPKDIPNKIAFIVLQINFKGNNNGKI